MDKRMMKTGGCFWLLIVSICAACLMTACSNSVNDDVDASGAGTVRFNIIYPPDDGDRVWKSAIIDCEANHINTVEVKVYNADHTFLVEGGPWDCDVGKGTINTVPAGNGRIIVVWGKAADESIIFRGEKSGINVIAAVDNNVGNIACQTFMPALQTPADGRVIQPSAAGFEWRPVSGASQYRIVVSEKDDMTDAINEMVTTDTSYTPESLLNAGTYYWRVFAIDAAGTGGAQSPIWSFSIRDAETEIPVLVSPADGAAISSGDVAFSWHGVDSTDAYRILVSENSDLSQPVVDVDTTAQNHTATTLSSSKTYHWQVIPLDADGEAGPGSQPWSFSIAQPQLEPPALQAPSDGSTIGAGMVKFSWHPVTDAVEYRIQVSENHELNDPVLTATTTSLQHTGSNFGGATTYFWRVTAIDSRGQSGRGSEIWSFDTRSWAYITTGANHTLAIKPEGTLWGWGNNEFGQVGTEHYGPEVNINTPTQIGTASDWAAVAAGQYHSVARKTNGTVYTWGNNHYGQLGLGYSGDTPINQPEQVGSDDDWSSIATGSDHTLAIKRNGELWTWGTNGAGQLGLGYGEQGDISDTPKRVDVTGAWRMVGGGNQHSVGLQTDGRIYAWGSNDVGEIGVGIDHGGGPFNTPTLVGSDWESVAVGFSHAIAMKTNGELWAWGANSSFQLGIVLPVGDNTSSPVLVSSTLDWNTIAVSKARGFAIKTNGDLWCWGSNYKNHLGVGDSSIDLARKPARIPNESRWFSVSSGRRHTVGLKTNGELYTWGSNEFGQLGLNDFQERHIPTHVVVTQ